MATAKSAVGNQTGTLHASGSVVLVVQDRPSRTRYADLLKRLGFTVQTAGDGETGLRALQAGCPKILVLDTNLPDVDGVEICREARDLHGDQISIVFVSEIEDLGLVENCLQAGGNDYIFASDGEKKFSKCVCYWATARPINRRQKYRVRTLAAIRAAAHDRERMDADDDAGLLLSSQSDSDVGMMAGIVERARNVTGNAFGHAVEDKLYLLGYVTGIVDHWATIQSHIMTHRADYIRAVLRESEIVSDREIGEMLTEWSALAQHPTFSETVRRGTRDAISCEVNGRRYCPTGLSLAGPDAFNDAQFAGLRQKLSIDVAASAPGRRGHE